MISGGHRQPWQDTLLLFMSDSLPEIRKLDDTGAVPGQSLEISSLAFVRWLEEISLPVFCVLHA